MKTVPGTQLDLIGLIPAAGEGTRISPSPCSKEIFPVGLRAVEKSGTMRPKVASHFLLEKMRIAGVTKAYFILRSGKWDIPAYFEGGAMLDMNIGYLMMGRPDGPPYTVDQAYPFAQSALIAFGFPDILTTPDDSFVHLLIAQKASQAELVLGLYLAHQSEQMDMVEIDDTGRVRSVELKPQSTGLRYAWIMALWTPGFTAFLHEYLGAIDSSNWQTSEPKSRELTMGHVIQAAVQRGLHVNGVRFPSGTYLDIGTSGGLSKVLGTGGYLGRVGEC